MTVFVFHSGLCSLNVCIAESRDFILSKMQLIHQLFLQNCKILVYLIVSIIFLCLMYALNAVCQNQYLVYLLVQTVLSSTQWFSNNTSVLVFQLIIISPFKIKYCKCNLRFYHHNLYLFHLIVSLILIISISNFCPNHSPFNSHNGNFFAVFIFR